MLMDPGVILFRLGVAAGLGFLLGLERELHGRAAGLRTNTIVTVSSCLLMIISLEFHQIFHNMGSNSVVRLDPSRVASYAVAGMGFLGAGAIIHGRGSVQGLTTAAGLWAGNAIGLAVGAGFIIQAVAALALILPILILTAPLIHLIPRDVYRRIYLDFSTLEDRAGEIKKILEDCRVKVLHVGLDFHYDQVSSSYDVAVRLKSNQDWSQIIQNLRRLAGLTRISWVEGYVP